MAPPMAPRTVALLLDLVAYMLVAAMAAIRSISIRAIAIAAAGVEVAAPLLAATRTELYSNASGGECVSW